MQPLALMYARNAVLLNAWPHGGIHPVARGVL
jgi:hypothetical protein